MGFQPTSTVAFAVPIAISIAIVARLVNGYLCPGFLPSWLIRDAQLHGLYDHTASRCDHGLATPLRGCTLLRIRRAIDRTTERVSLTRPTQALRANCSDCTHSMRIPLMTSAMSTVLAALYPKIRDPEQNSLTSLSSKSRYFW